MLISQTVRIFGEATPSGLAALGISGQALLIQLVTFVLAYWVLRRYAFKPILKVLDDRRQIIESGVALGEKMQKEQVALEAKIAASLHEARERADDIVAQSQDTARDTIREAEDRARQKADNILKDASVVAEQDAGRMRKALEGEIVGLISAATEVIIDEKIDAVKDAALIDRALRGHARA